MFWCRHWILSAIGFTRYSVVAFPTCYNALVIQCRTESMKCIEIEIMMIAVMRNDDRVHCKPQVIADAAVLWSQEVNNNKMEQYRLLCLEMADQCGGISHWRQYVYISVGRWTTITEFHTDCRWTWILSSKKRIPNRIHFIFRTHHTHGLPVLCTRLRHRTRDVNW